MLGEHYICKPDELSAEDRQRWLAVQQANPLWCSPFLHPQFAKIVYQARPDTRILIAKDQKGRRAWFAFHQLSGGLARPVGAPISDHQGMVQEPGFDIPIPELFAAAGIGALPFTAWSGTDAAMAASYNGQENTQLIDLSQGAETYFAAQQKQHHKYFKKMRQRARAVIRDHQSVELVTKPDDELLDVLFEWKHEQFTRTGKLDVLKVKWIREVLLGCYASTEPDFRAALFGYRVDGKWAAAELGLLANGIYHAWIVAYDPEFSRVSPGLLLLHGVIENCQQLGINQMDLGRGHDHYKKYYTSSNLPLQTGCLLQSGSAARQRKIVTAICNGFARLPLGKLGRLPSRLDGSLDYIAACHPKRSDQFGAFSDGIARKFRTKMQGNSS
ncbi:hypothetical protein MNBD_ALPHA06-1756 [hydrothermal vent metagenome]|uniref:BioF2-like acetyltransferase domain-containing protein n=1 Tax=hydrothermal vent metagenome TaxID=652676 RepID=A0A3B0RRG6_9ZZZZ